MRKKYFLVSLIFLPFLFTSCIDYVQTISYKDGKYQMYYKVTLSKMIFAMGDEDPDEMFESIDEDTIGDLPEGIEVNSVNTDLEVGAEYRFSIDPRTTDETEQSFLPRVSGEKIFVPFLLGEEDSSFVDSNSSSDDMGKAMTEAMLSSAKCRVIISKKILPSISKAYFKGIAGSDFVIPLYDYGEDYCLEIPFIILFEKSSYDFNKIVIVSE